MAIKEYLISTNSPTEEDFELLYGGVILHMKTACEVKKCIPAGLNIFENLGNFVGELPKGTEPVSKEDRYILTVGFSPFNPIIRICTKTQLIDECVAISA